MRSQSPCLIPVQHAGHCLTRHSYALHMHWNQSWCSDVGAVMKHSLSPSKMSTLLQLMWATKLCTLLAMPNICQFSCDQSGWTWYLCQSCRTPDTFVRLFVSLPMPESSHQQWPDQVSTLVTGNLASVISSFSSSITSKPCASDVVFSCLW